jgi:hypothetical protein
MRASGRGYKSKRARGGQAEKRTALVAGERAWHRSKILKPRHANHPMYPFTCFDPFWVL